MAEIIDFKTTKKTTIAKCCQTHTCKDGDCIEGNHRDYAEYDILLDEKVASVMQKWILGIDSNNVLESWKPTGPKPAGNSYAESVLSKSVLKMYGYNLPWQLVQAPCAHTSQSIELHNFYDLIYHDHTARKIMLVSASAYFFKMPVSRGLLSMLYNTPDTKRSYDFFSYKAVKSLIEQKIIIITNDYMEQPVQPTGIMFSSADNQIILPSKIYLHRFIEVVAWSLRFAVRNYSEMELAMQPYTDKCWKSAEPTAEGMHVFNFSKGVK